MNQDTYMLPLHEWGAQSIYWESLIQTYGPALPQQDLLWGQQWELWGQLGHVMGLHTHMGTCKGTAGSEAGDLSEPAVRRKSHKLETNWQEVQNINIKQ